MCRDVFALLPPALRLNQDLKAQQLHNCKTPTTAQFKIARDSNKPQKPLLEHLFQFLVRKSQPRRNSGSSKRNNIMSGRSKRNNIMIIRVKLPQQFFKSPFTLCFLCLNPLAKCLRLIPFWTPTSSFSFHRVLFLPSLS